jgi:predicted small metal-binding protein
MPAPHVDDAKRIACAEIVPDCPFTASAATEEELLQKVVAHAAHDHGITEVTPELAARVRAAIKTTEKHDKQATEEHEKTRINRPRKNTKKHG